MIFIAPNGRTEVSKVVLRSSTQSVAIYGDFFLRKLRLDLVSHDPKLEAPATLTLLRSLSQSCSKAADAPPHRFPWARIARVQVLARERTGPFSPTAAFASLQGNSRATRLREVRGGKINFWSRSIIPF